MPFRVSLPLVALLCLGSPAFAAAQGTAENAEARVYFEEGNRLYQEASAADGAERQQLLQRALEAYVDSLQIVRSRNALFNAAIVLGELGRHDVSFNYFTEYLAVDGLSESDRADATRRRDALRSRVAVLRITTVPEGATVWIDRKDLAPRGKTPTELALPEGTHTVFIEKDDHQPMERQETMVPGETVLLELSLSPLPEPPPLEVVAKEPSPAPPEPNLRLRNAAIGTGAATLAAAAAALGVSLRARSLRDDADQAAAEYRMSGDPADRQRAEDLADRTDRFNVTADVLWGTTIALGVSAIVLSAVHAKKRKSEAPRLSASVSRHGGYASLTMLLGARR